MSNDKILVSRDLLIDIAHGLRITHERGLAELRALLAQPSDGALPNEGAEPVARLKSLLAELGDALEDLEIWGRHSDQGYRKLKDWYRKAALACLAVDSVVPYPPAPASVVLPERKDPAQHWVEPCGVAKADGWNACLDRVKELNP